MGSVRENNNKKCANHRLIFKCFVKKKRSANFLLAFGIGNRIKYNYGLILHGVIGT